MSQAFGSSRDNYRRKMTPSQLAAWKVKKILENFPDTSTELRESYYAEIASFPQIMTMNSEMLAAALMLLFRTREQLSPEVFANRSLIIGVLSRILPNAGDNISNETLALYKADLLRYVRAILFNREQEQSDLFLNPEDEPTADELEGNNS
jgi:hypothetical protein